MQSPWERERLPRLNPQLVLLQTLPPTLLTTGRAWASSPAMMAMSIVLHAIPGPGSVNRTEEPKLRGRFQPLAASQPSPHPLHTTQQLCEWLSGPETARCAGLRPGAHRAMPGAARP